MGKSYSQKATIKEATLKTLAIRLTKRLWTIVPTSFNPNNSRYKGKQKVKIKKRG